MRLLARPLRRFLSSRDDKISHGTAFELRRPPLIVAIAWEVCVRAPRVPEDAPKSRQTYEPKVLIEMREWIGPALAPPDLCLTRRRACVGNVRARNGAVGRPMALSHIGVIMGQEGGPAGD